MEIKAKSVRFDRYIPILTIQDGVVVSKRGELTVGWEVALPPLCSVTEDGYEDMLESLSSAVRSLGQGFIVHRQDIYLKDSYHAERREDSFQNPMRGISTQEITSPTGNTCS